MRVKGRMSWIELTGERISVSQAPGRLNQIGYKELSGVKFKPGNALLNGHVILEANGESKSKYSARGAGLVMIVARKHNADAEKLVTELQEIVDRNQADGVDFAVQRAAKKSAEAVALERIRAAKNSPEAVASGPAARASADTPPTAAGSPQDVPYEYKTFTTGLGMTYARGSGQRKANRQLKKLTRQGWEVVSAAPHTDATFFGSQQTGRMIYTLRRRKK